MNNLFPVNNLFSMNKSGTILIIELILIKETFANHFGAEVFLKA